MISTRVPQRDDRLRPSLLSASICRCAHSLCLWTRTEWTPDWPPVSRFTSILYTDVEADLYSRMLRTLRHKGNMLNSLNIRCS